MASLMFGTATGTQIAREDTRAQQLHDMQIKNMGLEVEGKQLNINAQQKMAQLMSQGGGAGDAPGEVDLADSLDKLAEIAIKSGLPEKAASYAGKASTMRKNEAYVMGRQNAVMLKNLSLYSSMLEGVSDERTWKQANAMYAMETGGPSPFGAMPYDPQKVERLKMGVTTAKDRALTRAADARIKATNAEIAERQARVPLIQAQTQLANDRDAALAKAGTKPPKAGELKAITDLAEKDFGGAGDPARTAELRAMSRPVAERMLTLIQTQKLSQSEAAQRAYQEAKSTGQFGGLKQEKTKPGSVPKQPLELPIVDGKVDRKKVQENLWYNVKGTPRLLLGGQLYTQDELTKLSSVEQEKDDEEPDDDADEEE